MQNGRHQRCGHHCRHAALLTVQHHTKFRCQSTAHDLAACRQFPQITIKFEDSGGQKTLRDFKQLTKVAAAAKVEERLSMEEELEKRSMACFDRCDAIQVRASAPTRF
eukprot:SAG11_NODE_19409_length_467_cov_0.910326_1_plen_107_part_10